MEMCPEFERVERIVQNMVDKTEKVEFNRSYDWIIILRLGQVSNEETGRDVPSEERMIKRFRRSAAGYDEQLPSDIRTPETLWRTLNYLLDNVIGGEERLATLHKFVWDRTRGIRNDFSIQQVTKDEDVRIAVDCFERIARFHILSLHQLSNPQNLVGEHFDPHQEREQLNNTLLSLMYYYDDHRGRQKFNNEAEFRAYCIIFELQSQQPDLEDRMQSWPQELLTDPRIRIAFELYSAAANTLYDQGPLRPQAAFDIAQGNAVGFWNRLKSKAASYLMACVAEIYFGQVRFVALQGLWKSIKRAPASMQAKYQDWTLEELTKLLGFDDEDQAFEFCGEYDLGFKYNDAGVQYLDFTSKAEMTLDSESKPHIPRSLKSICSYAVQNHPRQINKSSHPASWKRNDTIEHSSL
jgi:nuclear mRNA export protein SAC3